MTADEMRQRAATDPSLPLGQDEPEHSAAWSVLAVAVIALVALLDAALLSLLRAA